MTAQRIFCPVTIACAIAIEVTPAGILDITRHTDASKIAELLGTPKNPAGYSDAEVMLYILARETGRLETFMDHAKDKRAGMVATMRASGEALSAAVGNVPIRLEHGVAVVAKAGEKAHGYIGGPRPGSTMDLILQREDVPSSRVDKFGRELSHGLELAARKLAELNVDVVQDFPLPGTKYTWTSKGLVEDLRSGEAQAVRWFERAIEFAVRHAAKSDAAEDRHTKADGFEPVRQFGLDAVKRRVAFYAEAIGVQTSKDGQSLCFEDLVDAVFAKVAAGGEVMAGNVLPGRQSLLGKLRENGATTEQLKTADEVLSACRHAMAMWMAEENFLRHLVYSTFKELNAAFELGATREEFDVERLRRSTHRILSMLGPGAITYHPSHDAEQAFEILAKSLGGVSGDNSVTLSRLAEMCVARNSAMPRTEPFPVPPPPPAPTGVTMPTTSNVVAGGTAFPKWHSGSF